MAQQRVPLRVIGYIHPPGAYTGYYDSLEEFKNAPTHSVNEVQASFIRTLDLLDIVEMKIMGYDCHVDPVNVMGDFEPIEIAKTIEYRIKMICGK